MTTFATSNVPSSVNTVEKLAAWACAILAEVNPGATIVTAPGVAENIASSYNFTFKNQSTNPERWVSVSYLALNSSWRGGGKFWNGIAEISTTTIPSGYLSN